MAARTPKQTIADSKKRKPGGKAAMPAPLTPSAAPAAPPDLTALRAWVPKTKAKAITAKAKQTVKGMKLNGK